jgi:diguanylate cyclase (GGDEF)-like protein
MSGASSAPRRRFVSLGWQAVVAVALTLLLSNGFIAFRVYRNAAEQFDLARAERRGQSAETLRYLFAADDAGLFALANAIPLFSPDDSAEAFTDRLSRALGEQGSMLSIDWDVLAVHWISAAGDVRLSWPASARVPVSDLQSVLCPEGTCLEPRQTVLCADGRCRQYFMVPVLWRGEARGQLVLERSIAEALLTSRDVLRADIVLLGTGREAASGLPPVSAMTGGERTQTLLDAFPAELLQNLVTPSFEGAAEGVLIASGSRWYDVYRVDRLGFSGGALVIEDVTEARQAIQHATRDGAVLGFAALLVSAGGILVLLSRPLRRVRRLSASLPMLAERHYDEVRQRIDGPRASRWAEDELDLLSTSALQLTNRMQELEIERERSAERIAWLASYDTLTRLLNRSRFMEEFQAVLRRARRNDQDGALLFIDLDRFKEVNDLSGHHAGDQLLAAVADTLQATLSEQELLSRIGGDEFAIALPRSTRDEACSRARQVIAALAALEVGTAELSHRCSVSIGVSLFRDGGHEAEEHLMRAEVAMYEARRQGPGRLHVYSQSDGLTGELRDRAAIRQRIADALENERFRLFFQPIVSIASGALHHHEVLVRLEEADGTLVPPGDFIPLAEETGLIEAVDRWVIREAIAALAKNADWRLSVNLSARSVAQYGVLADIPEMLAEASVDARRLVLEITETTAMLSLPSATALMTRLLEDGFCFAMDDFGSGYASYAYLRRLPFQQVKIDGAFVVGLKDSPSDAVFIRSITEMAHSLGKEVVAEYVEDEAIYRKLAELGVDYAQGYFLGRPLPVPAMGPWPPGISA